MDMGRTRQAKNRGLPPNLYPNRGGFKYRHPATRKETFMGYDRAQAIAAAKKLNAILIPAPGTLVGKVLGEKTIGDSIDTFLKKDVPGRGWSEKTAADYGAQLERMRMKIGADAVGTFSVKDCAQFLAAFDAMPRTRKQFRCLLVWVLASAVQEGWAEANAAESTRTVKHTRARERLTLEAYKAIYAEASAWLQRAMDLSLLTLLRREDVCSLRFGDHREGRLWVVPSKTEDTTNVRLKIKVDEQLLEFLRECRDQVVSPFVIHRLPEKARPSDMRAKRREHHTQVLPEQLSRAFQEARDQAKVGGENPPTFHEIRSLGGKLLLDAGWTVEQVQALMGHASEEMTQHYIEGHERPWMEVSTGIKLPSATNG